MSRIVYSDIFIDDLVIIKDFLDHLAPKLYNKFTTQFKRKIKTIKTSPNAFLPVGDNRVYFMEFGSSGYAIQYHYDVTFDVIKLLRIKHQRESGF
jgi:mRNA-degrading endonuclease RelE of RelBE toxin-antitoxin system